MGKVENESYISHVQKSFTKIKNKGIMYVTFKRSIFLQQFYFNLCQKLFIFILKKTTLLKRINLKRTKNIENTDYLHLDNKI